MSNFRDNYSDTHPERTTMYFGHMETNSAYNAILDYRENANENGSLQPLVIIGLSWGGSEAIKLTNKLGISGVQTDLLVTLDPVGSVTYSQVNGALANSSEWRNVSSDSVFSTSGSMVAAAWGRNETAKNFADVNTNTHFSHEDIVAMLNTNAGDGSSAAQAIEKTYTEKK